MAGSSMLDSIDNPIFIIGSGRSGTTLLRMMLNAHPNIYISNEASYWLYKPRAKTSGEWLDLYQKTVTYLWMKFPRKEVEEHVPRNLPKKEIYKAFDILMRIKAAQYNKKHYGDKTPSYCWHLERILTEFPKARIIHIVRDPVATVTSLKCMPWTLRSIGLISIVLARQMAKTEEFKEKIFEIRLEDLLESPETVMRKTLEFVGEDWSDQVIRHQEFSPQDDMPPYPWFVTAKKKASTDAALTSAIFPKLSSVEKTLVEYTNRATIQQFGYRRAPFKWSTMLACALYMIKDIPLMCLDIIRVVHVLLVFRTVRKAEDTLWPNVDAWKYYPEFKLHDVTDWENS
jgi:hypothetical protein